MVLVLAALYTYHQYQQNSSEDDNVTRLQQSLTQSFQTARRGAALALGRCHSNNTTVINNNNNMNIDEMNPQQREAVLETLDEDTDASPLILTTPPNLNIFQPRIRQEWINAVFGTDFFNGTNNNNNGVPRQGVGLANIASYVTYTATIPANSQGDKVGVTISRMPLGLYVRHVAIGSEAFCAGIQPDSILVEMNGMGMLAEPTRQALERMWLYEGILMDTNTSKQTTNDATKKTDTTESSEESSQVMMREPVALKFIKNGEMYTVVLLTNPPWGISWAPCANFPLVKRTYSLAAEAGVRKGSIVAAVNGKSFRELDHADAAMELRDLFQSNQEIRMTLCFTPPAARTGHYERSVGQDKHQGQPPRPKVTATTQDGVEVKFYSLEYAIGNLCHAGGVRHETLSDHHGTVQEMIDNVAAGVEEAPTGMEPRQRSDPVIEHVELPSRPSRTYMACPRLPQGQLLDSWDPLEALLYCLRFDRCNYDEERFVALLDNTNEKPPIEALHALTSGSRAPRMVDTYLLQFISLICSPAQYMPEQDEKKSDDPSSAARKEANELTSMLLKLSRRDEDFCQRLYFLLRSYISTFETSRAGKEDGSRNLMALLHCLELLRFAEKELAGRTKFGRPVRHSLDEPVVSPSESSAASPVPVSPASTPVSAEMKHKGMFGFLRKKKPKNVYTPPASKKSPSSPRRGRKSLPATPVAKRTSLNQSPSAMYENMSDFLGELDHICGTIERSLQKSFRQKIAEWAMQPWSPSKDSALASVTSTMRESLREAQNGSKRRLLVNPVESSELLSSVDCSECYILPSAHFPILLTFNVSERRSSDSIVGEERLYRTRVELVALRGSERPAYQTFTVHGAVAGSISASGSSNRRERNSTRHTWSEENNLVFTTRSSWGAPQTLSLRVSSNIENKERPGLKKEEEVGFSFVDLSDLWTKFDATNKSSKVSYLVEVLPIDSRDEMFDDQGDLPATLSEHLELELKVSVKSIGHGGGVDDDSFTRKRMLLYKHDDDLRQEAFAVQFIRTCDKMLRTSGLDMKLLTFSCIPVGVRRGFVEWVPGSVPLSEICQPFAGSILEGNEHRYGDLPNASPSMFAKAGLSKYESLRRLGGQQNDSLRRLGSTKASARGSFANNPIQDYLRSVAYDVDAPYLIKRDVMDTYIRSCAGYCLITYILGVGDRHLDNLLLHQSGCFFHCDYTFLLGADPKRYLPMRITDDMIYGMGGRESDNFAMFLSLIGAAFLALRRPESVRILLSMVRIMEASCLPDISENQTTEAAVMGVRDRLRLDLNDDQAVAFMEDLIEASISNKMWLAVDAIHSLGKKF